MTKANKKRRAPERAKWVRGQAAVRAVMESLATSNEGAAVDLRLAPIDDPIWVWPGLVTGTDALLDADERPLHHMVAGAAATGATLVARYGYAVDPPEDDEATEPVLRGSFRVKFPGRDTEHVVLSPAHLRSIRVHSEPVRHTVGEFTVTLHDDGGARVATCLGDARWAPAEVKKAVRLLAAHAGLEVASSPRTSPSPRPAKP